MIQNIKAIIFDCDGTLINTEHAHYLSWKHALKILGYDLSLEKYYSLIGHPSEEIALMFSKKLNKDCYATLLRDKQNYYLTLQRAGLPPFEDTVNFAHELAKEKKRLNIKLAIASAASKESILTNLEHLKIQDLFDVIVSGKDDLHDYLDGEGKNKPKPYVYQQAAKLLGAHPKECIAIEDSAPGVAAGIAAGCYTVAIPTSFTKYQDLSKAHIQIKSFKDMTANSFFEIINSSPKNKQL